MSSVVVSFDQAARRRPSQVWRPDEIAEVYRVIDMLARAGLGVSMESGVSDEGDPWLVVLRDDTADVIVHVARIDGRVVAVSVASDQTFTGSTLAEAMRAVLKGQTLILPRDDVSFFVHPATILAAFVTTALAHAAGTAGHPQGGSEAGGEAARTTHGQSVEPASTAPRPADAPSYSPSFLAAAVAAVAAVVALTSDGNLPISQRQAFLPLEVTASLATLRHHDDKAPPLPWAQTDDGFISVNADIAHSAIDPRDDLEEQALPPLSPAPSVMLAATELRLTDIALPKADAEADPFAPMSQAAPVLSSHEPTTILVEPVTSADAATAQPAEAMVLLSAMPISTEETPAFTQMEPDLVSLGNGNLLYWTAASLLDILPHGLAERAEWSLADRQQATADVSVGPVVDTDPAKALSSDTFIVVSVPIDASPQTKAAILTGFVHDERSEFSANQAQAEAVLDVVVTNPFLADVDRVILFEGDGVDVDMFMLMPNVSMLRADLAPSDILKNAPARQVDFHLTDGTTLRLLGVVDV